MDVKPKNGGYSSSWERLIRWHWERYAVSECPLVNLVLIIYSKAGKSDKTRGKKGKKKKKSAKKKVKPPPRVGPWVEKIHIANNGIDAHGPGSNLAPVMCMRLLRKLVVQCESLTMKWKINLNNVKPDLTLSYTKHGVKTDPTTLFPSIYGPAVWTILWFQLAWRSLMILPEFFQIFPIIPSDN